MPVSSYPIDGTVYGITGVAQSGATVTFINCSTGDRLSTTTNTSGQYLLDLANFKNGYSNADVIVIMSTYGNYKYFIRHTVNMSVGSASFDHYLWNATEKRTVAEWGTRYYSLNNPSLTALTTKTVLMPATNVVEMRYGTVTITNHAAAGNLTVSIWCSDLDQPGEPGLAGEGWSLNGSTLTVNAGTSGDQAIVMPYKWVCVTSTSSGKITNQVDVGVLITT